MDHDLWSWDRSIVAGDVSAFSGFKESADVVILGWDEHSVSLVSLLSVDHGERLSTFAEEVRFHIQDVTMTTRA